MRLLIIALFLGNLSSASISQNISERIINLETERVLKDAELFLIKEPKTVTSAKSERSQR